MASIDISNWDSVGMKIVALQANIAQENTDLINVQFGTCDWSQDQLPAANISNTDGEGINFNNNQMDWVYQQLWKITAPQPDTAQEILEELSFLFLTAPHRSTLTDIGCISLTVIDADMPMINERQDGIDFVAHLLLELRYNLPNPN